MYIKNNTLNVPAILAEKCSLPELHSGNIPENSRVRLEINILNHSKKISVISGPYCVKPIGSVNFYLVDFDGVKYFIHDGYLKGQNY
jgi:hypothetical protein